MTKPFDIRWAQQCRTLIETSCADWGLVGPTRRNDLAPGSKRLRPALLERKP